MIHNKFLSKAFMVMTFASLVMTGCGNQTTQNDTVATVEETTIEASTVEQSVEETTQSTEAIDYSKVASAEDTVTPEDVVEPGMTPITGDMVKDGEYDVVVDCSSSMFSITSCKLIVKDGNMEAVMTMGGKGYLCVYMGTGVEASTATENDYIPFAENEQEEHTFTVPVKALDEGLSCAAFSKKKLQWYDRILVFRADSLPQDAFAEGMIVTCSDLGLEDGVYTVDVSLAGGSGRASVTSPTTFQVKDGEMTAVIEWSSSNYDYMVVNDEKYETVNTEGNSIFEIPVTGFDYNMPVRANTTAMSTPHEIEYTLNFAKDSIQKAVD